MAYLGIDLGTTNSVAVIFDNIADRLDIVKIEGLDEVLPSVVCFHTDEVVVGSEAKNGAVIYPEETILSIKRKMGDIEPLIINGDSFLPEEISSILLKKLKDSAELQGGEIFDEVVITHPAYFNDRQVFATKKAGELAGFRIVHLLSEPLAAAIEYGYKQGYAQTLLIYDLGGGTFDACVLKVNQDIYGNETFQELSDVGDMHLGGDDFDHALTEYMITKFEMMTNIDLGELEELEYSRVLQKLRQEAEQLKKKLSITNVASVKISPLLIYEGIPRNLNLEVTKEDFEGLIRSFVDKSRNIVEEALARASKEPDEISKVILVGGSTLIPMVKRMVAGYIKEPYRATDPAKSVAMGAAIYNYLIHLPNSKIKVGQITRQIFGTEAIVNETTMEKRLIPIIPMGTSIPTQITDNKFKASEGSSAVRVDVYQWEEGLEEDRKYIGSLILEGIENESSLEITYSINEDNIFEVFVMDQKTKRVVSAQLDRTKRLPKLPERSFTPETKGMNIVFIMDTTGSMDSYINGVQEKAIEFSKILKDKGVDFQLGLIGFGDLLEKEKPKVYKFTNDILKFQKRIRKIPRNYGGDLPESSLDALETGLKLVHEAKLDPTHKTIFILITDAPPHIPTVSGKDILDILGELDAATITTYVVARKDKDSLEAYQPLIQSEGKYYSMDDSFYDILDNIAYSIAELVRV
ncbi:MAG: hypothetical protein CVU84_15510 [Firmicutes bacterium HGW-Firmicutes-1]|jgi:molecular chaperone DnaK|nr:MAG: hypothetical protein CVU84_15510 [Firmicutes bacterium HGW-Firmicutes-1]